MKSPFVLLICVLLACGNTDSPTPIMQPDPTPSFDRQNAGLLDNLNINEASGLAASYANASMLWTHNDSGDKNRIFLIDNKGVYKAEYLLEGCSNRDWEDIASLTTPEGNFVYVSEIGDNNAIYGNYLIYRTKEPKFGQSPAIIPSKDIDKIRFKYEDGNHDAECLMIDPQTKDLYIVTKREAKSRVYQLPYPQSFTTENVAKFVLELPFNYVTAGDISADGKQILIKNYAQVYYWQRTLDQSIAQILQKNPESLPYLVETQGEAICWTSNSLNYYTTTEGYYPPLYFYQRK